MADSLTSTITTTIAATKSFDVNGIGSLSVPFNLVHATSLANGTAANQADHMHVRDFDTATGSSSDSDIPSGGTGSLDLNDSATMLDVFGQSAAMAKVKVLRIVHKAGSSSGNVTVTGNFMDQFASAGTFSASLDTGSELLLVSSAAAGFAVVNTTQDTITITETTSAGAAKVEVTVIGTSV